MSEENTNVTANVLNATVKKGQPNRNGRPLGAKNKPPQGLAISKRLKVLQKIILNNKEKASDRLTAIKLMTEILSDKVLQTPTGATPTIIKFEENTKNKAIENTKNKENTLENIEVKRTIEATTTSTTTTKSDKTLENTENTIELNFSFEDISKDTKDI